MIDLDFDLWSLNSDFTKGQVALEGNFRFVQDKSDFKSASDKKFVREATVALENKICEQNTTPCCEVPSIFDVFSAIQAHVFLDSRLYNWSCFSAHSWTNNSSSSLLHQSWPFLLSAKDVGREEVELDDGVEVFSMNCGEDSGKDSAFVTDAVGLWLTFPQSFNV